MIKTLLWAALAWSCSFQAVAQQGLFTLRRDHHTANAIVQAILDGQATAQAAQKPTGIQQRVIAQTIETISGSSSTLDSFRYAYSGANTSTYNFNQVGYNQSFEPVYAPMIADYRNQANPLYLLADSMVKYHNHVRYDLHKAYYRSDKKLDSIHTMSNDGSGNFATDNSLIHYNTDDNIQEIYALEDDGLGGLDTYSYRRFYYNTANTGIVADTNIIDPGSSVAFSENRYVYNALSGKLDTSYNSLFYTGGELRARTFFSYYPDGRLEKAVRQTFNGLEWATDGYDSIGYTGALDYYTYWKKTSVYTSGSQIIEISTLTRQFPGAGGVPDSVWQYGWDSQNTAWAPLVKWDYTYNASGNPLKFTATSFETGSPVPMGGIDFYYEDYNDGLSVVQPVNDMTFQVYPNPFSNKINIDWKEKTQGAATVMLVSLSGQNVLTMPLWLCPGQNTVSLPAMAAGHYMLHIRDAAGRLHSCKMIKK